MTNSIYTRAGSILLTTLYGMNQLHVLKAFGILHKDLSLPADWELITTSFYGHIILQEGN